MTYDQPTRRTFIMGAAAGLVATKPRLAVGRIIGANERINVAVIGCGVRGKGNHMAELVKLAQPQNVRITAVCDVWQPALRAAEDAVAKAFQAKPFSTTNYEDLLTRDDVDAVTIATPDHAHAPMLTAACKAGKDVYCEKPMTVRLDDAKDALKAARDNKRVVQSGTQRRSDGLQQAWAEFFQAGKLGTVTKVEIGYHDNRPRWRRDYSDVHEKDVDWKRYLMYLPDRPFDPKRYRRWHLYKDYTLGPVSLLGSHYIDIVIWYLNAKCPTSGVQLGAAYVWGDDGREHPDTCDSLWDYPEGFLLLYTNHFGNSYNDGGILICGTNGTYVNGQVLPDGAPHGKEHFPQPFKVQAKPNQNHMRNWLECIRTRKDPNAPIEAGYYHSVATVLAAESLWRGRRMTYDPRTMTIKEG